MTASGLQASIVRFALRYRGTTLALAIVIAGLGAFQLTRAKFDVFPDFAPPQVSIQTEAPGLSPEQVEQLVTSPVERAVEGLQNQESLRSDSIGGLSVVTIYFDPSSPLYLDRQIVSERLAQVAGLLPVGVKPPIMTPLTSSAGVAQVIGLTSNSHSLMRQRSVAEWTIRPALLAVPGVSDVEIFGGNTEATEIKVNPERLIRFGLSLDDVLTAARRATGLRGAGFIPTPNQRILLQTGVNSLTPADIAKVVVATHDGQSVTLGNVADVLRVPEPAIGAAAIGGVPGVVLNVTEQYGANTLAVASGIDKALNVLKPELQREHIQLHAHLFQPSRFISLAIRNLASALLLGAGLVIIIVFLFLLDLRLAAICCLAIPLSLLAASLVLSAFSTTMNTMTIGGLAIALGEVVDDAVIAVDNITHRLRENRLRPDASPSIIVILEAVVEVRSAVVYATFAVILVFLPILTLSGVAGSFFAPLALAYIAAVLCSLGVALTVTPALAFMFSTESIGRGLPKWLDALMGIYRRVLLVTFKRPRLIILSVAVVIVSAVAALPFFDATFFPDLHEGHFIVHMTAMPGTSLSESLRMGTRVAGKLEKLPFVRSVAQRIGRAELTLDTHGSHQSEFEVDLRSAGGKPEENAKARIMAALSDIPGVTISVNTFLTERINETLSGETAPVAIHIFGSDLKAIDTTAAKVDSVVARIPGAASVQLTAPQGVPTLSLKLRSAELVRWGLDPTQVTDLIATAYQGDLVGQTFEGDRSIDVLVKLSDTTRSPLASLEHLRIRTPSGIFVPLRNLIHVSPGSGAYDLQHQGGLRVQSVTSDVEGRSVSAFVADATKRINQEVKVPAGVYISFSGAAEAEAGAQRDLAIKSVAAGVCILLLLSFVARNGRNLLIIIANVPFALVGGIGAVALSGGVLSLGSLVGFVTLFGITLRNAIMMIAHFRHITEIGGKDWSDETAIEGACDRLPAILMTSLVTGLGLLPLAVSANQSGREIEGPMAIVILGGLVTSMILNLLVVPSLARRYGRFERSSQSDPLLLAAKQCALVLKAE
ncbi:MAG: CusA/CzcA family heavy metal efflux RND transporter [Rhodospirillales bacterium 20-64-7]|nr:MAG: CusA/CzcA family heavy metal efflux RND transporter [Rhodospirillales bacterium 20-64-7]